VEDVREEFQNGTVRLKIGLPDSGGQMPVFFKAGRMLQEMHKDVVFSWDYIAFNEWQDKLYEEELDIMIMLALEEKAYDPAWQYERVMTVPKLVCMLRTNPLCQKESITYEDLREQRFIVNSRKIMPMHYDYICEITRENGGFEPIVARFTKNPHGLIGNLEHDDEVVVCDQYIRDINNDFIKCFDLPGTMSGLDAVWRKANANPYISAFIQLTKEQIQAEFLASDHSVAE
jgi:hypothetical protein